MARKLRVEYAGAIYHVTVRSNGGRLLCCGDTDRRYLLDRIAQASAIHRVRVYLFCLMSNHFHLVVETPIGNLGRFMQGILTGYGVYFNRVHREHGHVTQGRYGARLVQGNEYLLKLSRYVHLNPVKIKSMQRKSLEERLALLRSYPWSSYLAYAGLRSRNEFVDYAPILALVGGRTTDAPQRYRTLVETGVATEDEEFRAALVRSAHCIGDDDFRESVEDRYRQLLKGRRAPEDVAFRCEQATVSPEVVLQAVAAVAGMDTTALRIRRRDSRWRAVASRMLCQYSGLTQREVATVIGLHTGVAVSCQLRKLTQLLTEDAELKRQVGEIEKTIQRQLGKNQKCC
jgi:REP element-mobilizing transposase RayT